MKKRTLIPISLPDRIFKTICKYSCVRKVTWPT